MNIKWLAIYILTIDCLVCIPKRNLVINEQKKYFLNEQMMPKITHNKRDNYEERNQNGLLQVMNRVEAQAPNSKRNPTYK